MVAVHDNPTPRPLRSMWLHWTLMTALIAGAAVGIYLFEKSARLDAAQARLQTEITYLSHTLSNRLQVGDFQGAKAEVEAWGRLNEESTYLSLVADNGFSIAEFRREESSVDTIRQTAELPVSYHNSARLTLEKSLTSVNDSIRILGTQLLLASILIESFILMFVSQLHRHRWQVKLTEREVERRLAVQREMEKMATHDALTGLPNRRQLDEQLVLRLAEAARFGRQVAVLFIDLDNFKQINDRYGHGMGDLVLKLASERMQACLRAYDLLVRFGGDEFVVVLANIKDADEIEKVARKLITEIQPAMAIDGHELSTSASIGISRFPDDAERPDELLRLADVAMYQAKEQGRNRFHFHAEEDA